MTIIGTVLETSRRGKESAHFEWRIERWRRYRRKYIFSPDFYFAGTDWRMELHFSTAIIEARLARYFPCHEPAHCWLRVRRTDGEEEEIGSGTQEPGYCECNIWTLPDWKSRSVLESPWQRDWSHLGTLTFLIRMSTAQETETKLNSVQKDLSDLQKQHNSSMLEFRKTKRENEVLEQKNNDLVKQLEERRGDIELSSDFSDLQDHLKKLLSADDHDVLLRVQTKEFRAHKNVLRARSPVFEAMFKHGMKEDTENTVDIEDCDPDCFGQFLEYVYTGQVGDLSPVNAPSLYFCGDKYGFPGLRRRCIDLLQSSLSVPLVSDVIDLAVTHGEEDLLETVMDYVTQHLTEVMESVEWQRFAISNPIRANEVCLKAVKRRESADFRK